MKYFCNSLHKIISRLKIVKILDINTNIKLIFNWILVTNIALVLYGRVKTLKLLLKLNIRLNKIKR